MKIALLAIIGLFTLVGCKTMPRGEDKAVEIVVMPSFYIFQKTKFVDHATMETALLKSKAEIQENGCMIKVAQKAPEKKLLFLLDMMAKMKVETLSVLTLKEK